MKAFSLTTRVYKAEIFLYLQNMQIITMKKENLFYYILGLFAGDGWFAKRGITICTSKYQEALKIAERLEILFDKKPKIKRRIYPDEHVIYNISVYSVFIEKSFRKILGNVKKNKSKTFVLPKFPNQNMARCFVKGIFDAESYSYTWKGQPRIAFEIYNEKASNQIYKILKKDLVCSLSKRSNGGFRIDITGTKNLEKYQAHYLSALYRE